MTPSPKQTAPSEATKCSACGYEHFARRCPRCHGDAEIRPLPVPATTPEAVQAPTQERVFFDCCGRMDDEGHAASCKGPLASTLAVKDAEIAHERMGRASEAKAHLATMEKMEKANAEITALRKKLEEAEQREAGGHDAAAVVAYAAREIERVERNEKVTREGWRAEKARADAAAKERDAKDAKITSLRAALTEAVDKGFDYAAALDLAASWLRPDSVAATEIRNVAQALRAKAEAWRKVLTDSEVTNAR